MAMERKTVAVLSLGAAGALVWLGIRQSRGAPRVPYVPGSTPPPPGVPGSTKAELGDVVCPAEVSFIPASMHGARRGDFVTIRLSSKDGKFGELVWAVLSENPNPKGKPRPNVLVRLTGALGGLAVSFPKASLHGFDVGMKLLVSRECAWDVFRTSKKGMALCGQFGVHIAGHGTPAAVGSVVAGEDVRIFVGPVKLGTKLQPGSGWDTANPTWAKVVHVSPAKNVMRVQLLEQPSHPDVNMLIGDRLDITRDCVFDTRATTPAIPGG